MRCQSLFLATTVASRIRFVARIPGMSIRANTSKAEEGDDKVLGSRFKVYTRTGDKGTTALFNGDRRAKDDIVFEALGTTDELSSTIGLAIEYCIDQKIGNDGDDTIVKQLTQVQCLLQDIGSNVATPRSSSGPYKISKTVFDANGSLATLLEQWIDAHDATLPPLTNFILPGGGKASATLHVARTIARRAERRLIGLVDAGEVDRSAQVYLNRLSDYLFTAARVAAQRENREERIYQRYT